MSENKSNKNIQDGYTQNHYDEYLNKQQYNVHGQK